MSSFLHCGPENWEDVTENSNLPQGRRLLQAWQRWIFQPRGRWETSGLALTSGHSLDTLTLFLLHSVLCCLMQPENTSLTLGFLGMNRYRERQERGFGGLYFTHSIPHLECIGNLEGMEVLFLHATGNYPTSRATASTDQIVSWEIDQMISRHLKIYFKYKYIQNPIENRFRAFPAGR